jgi:hypothetical protein
MIVLNSLVITSPSFLLMIAPSYLVMIVPSSLLMVGSKFSRDDSIMFSCNGSSKTYCDDSVRYLEMDKLTCISNCIKDASDATS